MNMDLKSFCEESFKKTGHYVLGFNNAKLFLNLPEYQPHYLIDGSEKTIVANLDVLVWAKGFPGINLYLTTDKEEKIIVSVKWRGENFNGYPIDKTGKDAKQLVSFKTYKLFFHFNKKGILSIMDIEEVPD